MANIFSGLENLDDRVIVDNIAMLKAVNMGNVFKGYGTLATNKSTKMINGLGKLFGQSKLVNVVEEKKIEDFIEEEKDKISHLSRGELDDRLMWILGDYANNEGNLSRDGISAKCITSSAKYLKVADYLTVAQKADAIHRRYLEKVLSSIQKELIKQDGKKANETEVEIERNIQNLSEDEKQKLKEVLDLRDLTGSEIRAVLMKTGTPALIMTALSASGFGAFMALTTIIHAVFTTILGVTIPFAFYTGATSALSFVLGPAGVALVAGTTLWQFTKGNKKIKNELISQLIFSSVSAYGGSFVAKDEDLPSFESDVELLKEIKKRDVKYEKLVEDNHHLQVKVVDFEKERSSLYHDLKKYKMVIENENQKKEESTEKIKQLELEKEAIAKKQGDLARELTRLEGEIKLNQKAGEDQYNEKINELNLTLEKETTKLNESIKFHQQLINEASDEIKIKESKIKEIDTRNLKLEDENKNLTKVMAEKEQLIDHTEKVRRQEIKEKWDIYYKGFEMTSIAIRSATAFSKKELWEIERALSELYALEDFRSISRGKLKEDGVEYDHLGLSLPSGFPTRILYRVVSNSDIKVKVGRIYKHSDKRLQ